MISHVATLRYINQKGDIMATIKQINIAIKLGHSVRVAGDADTGLAVNGGIVVKKSAVFTPACYEMYNRFDGTFTVPASKIIIL